MKNKLLNYALAACLIAPCAMSLTACFNQNMSSEKFTAAQGVLEKTETIIENLTENFYNSSALGSSTKYSVEELKANNSDFVYYVEVGSLENIENVDKVTLGGETFDDEQTFDLSIGNSNFISDKCFYSDENKLFVAAPIVAFESVNNAKIKINNSEFDFNLDKTADEANFTNAEFSAGSTNTISKNQDNSYNVEFKDAKSFLKLYYDGAATNDVVLTKKVVSRSGNEELNGKANYGLTKVENETNYPLALYPIGYSANALTDAFVTWYDNATMNYEAFVFGKGIVKATLNFDIILPSAE